MSLETNLPETKKSLLSQLTGEAVASLEELRALVSDREMGQSLRAKSNLQFIKEDISPKLQTLRNCKKGMPETGNTDLEIIFGLKQDYDPALDKQPKVVGYDGAVIGLYEPISGVKNLLILSREIKSEHDLQKHEGKETHKNIVNFIRMSKKEIVLIVISALKPDLSFNISHPTPKHIIVDQEPKPIDSAVNPMSNLGKFFRDITHGKK